MEPLSIEPGHEPTAVFIKPQVGYEIGEPTLFGPGDFQIQDREAFYASTHIQRIKFQIARRVVDDLLGFVGNGQSPREARMIASRHQLFPQVYGYVHQYVENRVDFSGQNSCELGLEGYMRLVAERLMNALQPDDKQGEPPLQRLTHLLERTARREEGRGSPDSRRRPSRWEGIELARALLADIGDTKRLDFEWEFGAMSIVLGDLRLPPIGAPSPETLQQYIELSGDSRVHFDALEHMY